MPRSFKVQRKPVSNGTYRGVVLPQLTCMIAQVVVLSNSDIVFDESLARLGDPSTLDMAQKVMYTETT